MSNTASPGLCKQLYELSGWPPSETYMWHYESTDEQESGMRTRKTYPKYDLGYLLRKLPPKIDTGDVIEYQTQYHWLYMNVAEDGKEWQFGYTEAGIEFYGQSETPENAATLLAIELLKSGVVTGEHSASQRASTPNHKEKI